jgi:23S rRNA pseudouridine955/2504/2580 synthase
LRTVGLQAARYTRADVALAGKRVRARIIGTAAGSPPAAVERIAALTGRSTAAGAAAAVAVRQLQVDEASEGQRLDNYLLRLLRGVPKTHVYRLIRGGEVRVNKGRASAETRLAHGDVVRVPPVRVAAAPAAAAVPARAFALLYEDEHLLAIDKPAGVAVHGGSGVSHGVIEQLRRARPGERFLELVHRLDKETSGVLLLARRRSALTRLQEQFRARDTDKVYAALVRGHCPDGQQVIDLPLLRTLDAAGERQVRVAAGGQPAARRAITLVRTQARYAAAADAVRACSLLDVTIRTGRTHQIRVHLAHGGHPILGDPKYGDYAWNRAWARGEALAGLRFDRMFLHARRLGFAHPADGRAVELEAPLPADCAGLLAALRGIGAGR